MILCRDCEEYTNSRCGVGKSPEIHTDFAVEGYILIYCGKSRSKRLKELTAPGGPIEGGYMKSVPLLLTLEEKDKIIWNT
jgi:hypothetical protein